LEGGGGMGSGSGNLAVVSLKRGDQRGSNGVGWSVSVAVLSDIWPLEDIRNKKSREKNQKHHTKKSSNLTQFPLIFADFSTATIQTTSKTTLFIN
jgi:hypothetical protein